MGIYIGTKLVKAIVMTRKEYNDLRGWTVPENENGADDGYLVEYLDGGKPNTLVFDGYVSWSPQEVFENAYRPTSDMNFGLAVEALKMGKKVCRAGWNGKGMWLKHIFPYINDEYEVIEKSGMEVGTLAPYLEPYIGMNTATNEFVPWLASQTDILADDWMIVE